MREFLANHLESIFSEHAVNHARASTSALAAGVGADPTTVLFALAVVLSTCAFLMGVAAFVRRGSGGDTALIEERLAVIEAILRDNANSRRLSEKQMTGEVAFFKRELEEIRSSLDGQQPTLKRISNG